MQACIYEQYGAAEVVRVGEVPPPTTRPHDILVRVHAAAVTTADWRFRASAFPSGFWLLGRMMVGLFRPRNPVLGMDFAGVVQAVGSKVSKFRVGDRVFGSTSPTRRGAHAEYVALPESGTVVHTPARLSDVEAAATPFGAGSALSFLRDIAKLQPDQRVLIIGASGNVGSWAVQIARHMGAEVTGVCSTPNVALVRALGARHVIDYTTQSFTAGRAAYDLIFDTVGVTTFGACQAALSAQGTFIPLVSGLAELSLSLRTMFRAKKLRFAVSRDTPRTLAQITGLIEAGVLTPVIDRVYPLAQIADAHRHVESRRKVGSVVVAIDPAYESPNASTICVVPRPSTANAISPCGSSSSGPHDASPTS